MKSIKPNTLKKSIILILPIILMIFSFERSEAQVAFLNSIVVPSARGTVDVKKDKYKNFVLDLEFSNLAEPSRLTPPKNTYVVWMVTEDNITKNIGQVKTKTTFLKKSLKASFETKSSFRPIKIFITAEYEPNILEPGPIVVLTTDNFNMPKE